MVIFDNKLKRKIKYREHILKKLESSMMEDELKNKDTKFFPI